MISSHPHATGCSKGTRRAPTNVTETLSMTCDATLHVPSSALITMGHHKAFRSFPVSAIDDTRLIQRQLLHPNHPIHLHISSYLVQCHHPSVTREAHSHTVRQVFWDPGCPRCQSISLTRRRISEKGGSFSNFFPQRFSVYYRNLWKIILEVIFLDALAPPWLGPVTESLIHSFSF